MKKLTSIMCSSFLLLGLSCSSMGAENEKNDPLNYRSKKLSSNNVTDENQAPFSKKSNIHFPAANKDLSALQILKKSLKTGVKSAAFVGVVYGLIGVVAGAFLSPIVATFKEASKQVSDDDFMKALMASTTIGGAAGFYIGAKKGFIWGVLGRVAWEIYLKVMRRSL